MDEVPSKKCDTVRDTFPSAYGWCAMVRSWRRVSARAGSAGAQVVRLLDNRDGPQPITGIERVSTRLRVLRKGKNSFYRGSTRQEFGLAWDVCDLSRKGGTRGEGGGLIGF